MNDLYNEKFYTHHRPISRRSAEVIVPIIEALFHPQSVCDVGCGLGAWLSVFNERGITDILGMDGSYVKSDMLMIPREKFREIDLVDAFAVPRRFDLAMSLEVAEHLPANRARPFVTALTKIAPVIVFSAAIPNQGGTGHVNEQWQDYWARLFAEHDFVPIDCIRPRIWNDEAVAWWYCQNILVYCAREALQHFSEAAALAPAAQLSIVHPRFIEAVINRRYKVRRDADFGEAVRALPSLFLRALRSRRPRNPIR
jgi:SAM-dependent methyltransferase